MVLGLPVEGRTYDRPWQKRLGTHRARLLERELYNAINPDAVLSYEAKALALDYFRRRLPEMLGWRKQKLASYRAAAWFFQQPIPCPYGVVVPGGRLGYPYRRRDTQVRAYWSW